MLEGDTRGRALGELRASVNRLQTAAQSFVSRAWADARSALDPSQLRPVGTLWEDSRKVRADLRRRIDRLLSGPARRGEGFMDSVREQARILEAIVKRLPVASRDEVLALRKRVSQLEERLDALAKERAA